MRNGKGTGGMKSERARGLEMPRGDVGEGKHELW